MDIKLIIEARHSVRSFTDQPIEGEVRSKLEKLIDECNIEGNLNINLVLNEQNAFDSLLSHYGNFINVKNYIVMAGIKDSSFHERCGYYGEKIVLKAQEIGLNTCWVGMSYSKRKVPLLLQKGETVAIVIAIGYGTTQKTPHHRIKTFEQVTDVSGEIPDWFRRGVEYALLAPTAVNQQKFIFKLIDGNKVQAIAGLGFFVREDLGIVKYHFELGAGTDNFSWV